MLEITYFVEPLLQLFVLGFFNKLVDLGCNHIILDVRVLTVVHELHVVIVHLLDVVSHLQAVSFDLSEISMLDGSEQRKVIVDEQSLIFVGRQQHVGDLKELTVVQEEPEDIAEHFNRLVVREDTIAYVFTQPLLVFNSLLTNKLKDLMVHEFRSPDCKSLECNCSQAWILISQPPCDIDKRDMLSVLVLCELLSDLLEVTPRHTPRLKTQLKQNWQDTPSSGKITHFSVRVGIRNTNPELPGLF